MDRSSPTSTASGPGREDQRPTKKELGQARELVERHGQAKARSLVQLAVKKLRERWPEAKTFGGVGRYLDEVAAEYDREQGRLEAERAGAGPPPARAGGPSGGSRPCASGSRPPWRAAWDDLPAAEREEIRRAVVAGKPYLERAPRMVEGLCLEELARRRGEAGSVPGPETPVV